MATSSILGGERAAAEPKGTDADALGPSDSSDSGSDAAGTTQRGTSDVGLEEATNEDILPDRMAVEPGSEAQVAGDVPDAQAADPRDLAQTDSDEDEADQDGGQEGEGV